MKRRKSWTRSERRGSRRRRRRRRRASLDGRDWARGRLRTASSPDSEGTAAATAAGMVEASAAVRRTSARGPFSSSWRSSWEATRERAARPAAGAVSRRRRRAVQRRRVSLTMPRGSPWPAFNIRATLVVSWATGRKTGSARRRMWRLTCRRGWRNRRRGTERRTTSQGCNICFHIIFAYSSRSIWNWILDDRNFILRSAI